MKYKNIKLGEAAEITMGQSPKSTYYNKEGMGIPFIQGVSTFGNNYPRIETYTTEYNKEAQKGDLLFSVRAPVGRINVANQTIAIGRGLASLKVKKGYSKSYIYYLFKKIGNQLDSIGSGTVFSSINKKELTNLKIRVPEKLHDQCKIADRLRKIDEEIEINNQINDNLLDIAQNIYHRILFSPQIAKTNLRSFATVVMGQSPSSKTYNENKIGIPLLNGAADFRNGIHPSKWTTDPKIIVNKGAYIFGVRATIGLTAKVSKSYAIGRGTGSAIPKDVKNEEILYFILNDMFKKFEQTESGSVYINISKNDFENYRFYIPDRNGLLFFHEKVKPIMDQIYINKKQNKILQTIKATLLSKIF